ncbi:MAG: EAL domain-containing protein [Campylobacterota bacterium]|nr:EAL domain-containing protein [Campylobacterota bacterium]
MNQLFSTRVLYLIPLIFLIVIVFRIALNYQLTKDEVYNFAKKEAEVLNSHAMAHREYYQELFISKVLPLNEETLPALPAYASRPISETFSKNNLLNVEIHTVSDRARNPINSANSDELKAIKFFKNNPDQTKYFSDENEEFFQYASALRIKQACLKCHGKKEDAPQFIQDNYPNAYDYKIGDVRGVMSIVIPKKVINEYFYKNFLRSIIYDLLLFITLFITIFFLLKKSKKLNDYLEIEIKSKTKELKDSLVIDRLTQLPNRLKLLEDIKNHDESSHRHLAILNIDRFKEINDFYGHTTGDEILKQTASTIKKICKCPQSIIYKLPSDEYAIFSTSNISADQFYTYVNNTITSIQERKYETGDNIIFITISCGIASNRELIITKADMALQIAKNDKRRVITYSDSMDTSERINQNLQGMLLLRDAIKNDNITPHFQPIYNVNTKKIEKYESLARIILDDGKVIAPFEFLDIAIKSKLYPSITRNIIRKSFEFFKEYDYDFSINISIKDILNSNTTDFILKSLEDFEKPQRVVFEILESDKIGNYAELKEFISRVKKFGCQIAIDDFGSGYSNFSHILELDIDYIKIDASLVKRVATDKNSKKITATIIQFASSLGVKTIAEFVEDKESLDTLQEMGVDFVQGYYIGKPESGLNKSFK